MMNKLRFEQLAGMNSAATPIILFLTIWIPSPKPD